MPLGEIFRIPEVRAPIIVQKHLFTEPPSIIYRYRTENGMIIRRANPTKDQGGMV